jgi:DNA modification methylase
MSTWRILLGDVRETLASLPDASVQCCVTSPPYWGLRDYGHDGQLGLEPTPDAYVANMVQVFREVKRVLRDDGTCWINLGDSYVANGGPGEAGMIAKGTPSAGALSGTHHLCDRKPSVLAGLPAKNLVGIPWRVAFALQADGWYLRSDIIWSKPNPMPESVTDRPTKAHEYLFLLTKSARYFYDAEAIREPLQESSIERVAYGWNTQKLNVSGSLARGETVATSMDKMGARFAPESGRNKRSVWHVATQPYAEAHFATYPEALITPCILAGTSEQGQCPACGAPWVRVVERHGETTAEVRKAIGYSDKRGAGGAKVRQNLDYAGAHGSNAREVVTTGWQPSCACVRPIVNHTSGGAILGSASEPYDPIPQTILDPFTGSGTTGAVAVRHQRSFVGCELNPEYLALARKRIGAVAPLLSQEVA